MKIFQKIDTFFEERKRSEKNIIFTSIIVAFLALSYQYLFPLSEKEIKMAKSKRDSIKNMLEADKIYLKSITVKGDPNFYIKQNQQTIALLKDELRKIVDKKSYLDYKIKEISYLLYNKKRWAHFLNSITQKANKSHIDINYITNVFFDSYKSFGHVLELTISANGDYKDLIRFINSIEESELVVDVYQIKMRGNNPIQTIFKVSVWGINI